jgi:TolA-binding protein
MSINKLLKEATDSFSLVGGLKDVTAFKRGGSMVFAGMKDSMREEDGKLVSGKDVRKSATYRESTGKEKRQLRAQLKDGVRFSNEEANLLLDSGGNLREEAVMPEEDLNTKLERLRKVEKMETDREDFMGAQEEAEVAFESRGDDDGSPKPGGIVKAEAADSGESGDIAKSNTGKAIDREVQDWVNALEAALTPAGPAQ